jgi:hypothetical protein
MKRLGSWFLRVNVGYGVFGFERERNLAYNEL